MSMSPRTSEPMLRGTLTIPYGFTSPLAGTVLPIEVMVLNWPMNGWSNADALPGESTAQASRAASAPSKRALTPDFGVDRWTRRMGDRGGRRGRREPRAWLDMMEPPM